jgi:hypothetical protein
LVVSPSAVCLLPLLLFSLSSCTISSASRGSQQQPPFAPLPCKTAFLSSPCLCPFTASSRRRWLGDVTKRRLPSPPLTFFLLLLHLLLALLGSQQQPPLAPLSHMTDRGSGGPSRPLATHLAKNSFCFSPRFPHARNCCGTLVCKISPSQGGCSCLIDHVCLPWTQHNQRAVLLHA